MFNNTKLIEISGISKRTFYRYKERLTNQGLIGKIEQQYYDEAEAKKIAEAMGFKLKFELYISKLMKA